MRRNDEQKRIHSQGCRTSLFGKSLGQVAACLYGRHSEGRTGAAYMRPMTVREKRPGRIYVGHVCPTYTKTANLSLFDRPIPPAWIETDPHFPAIAVIPEIADCGIVRAARGSELSLIGRVRSPSSAGSGRAQRMEPKRKDARGFHGIEPRAGRKGGGFLPVRTPRFGRVRRPPAEKPCAWTRRRRGNENNDIFRKYR